MPAKKKATKKAAAPAKPPTKSEILNLVAADTGLTRKDVSAVLDSLNELIGKNLKKHGLFSMPGLMKMKVVKKPATRARKGINPFTGEETVFKAKPARKVVKIQALKALKDKV
jgi:nucleoid DNA-binding protein